MSNKNHDHKDILGHSDQLNQQAPQDLSRKDSPSNRRKQTHYS